MNVNKTKLINKWNSMNMLELVKEEIKLQEYVEKTNNQDFVEILKLLIEYIERRQK